MYLCIYIYIYINTYIPNLPMDVYPDDFPTMLKIGNTGKTLATYVVPS